MTAPRELEYNFLIIVREWIHRQKVTQPMKSYMHWESQNNIKYDGQFIWLER
jgi:hypothetical protein